MTKQSFTSAQDFLTFINNEENKINFVNNLAKEKNIDCKDVYSLLLQNAVLSNNLENSKLLIELGADPHYKNMFGNSAMSYVLDEEYSVDKVIQDLLTNLIHIGDIHEDQCF